MLSLLNNYKKTLATSATVLLVLIVGFTKLRISVYEGLWPFFQWMDGTWFGVAGKNWGALFALVEAFHLLALAMLGGAVFVSNGRLLGILLTNRPAETVVKQMHNLLIWALVIILASGIFMVCGLATRVYYLPVFWFKMLALGVGLLFEFFIRHPLLQNNIEVIKPWIVRAVAIASIMIWTTVAATGRWIGYAG